MALSESSILSAAQDRTLRTDITSISTELAGIMYEICNTVDCLERKSSVTMSAGTYSVALTSGYKNVHAVEDADGNGLDRVTITEITAFKSGSTSTGTAEMYAVFADSLYVWPAPTAEMVFSVYNSYESVLPTALPAHFDECLIEGVCFKMYEGKGLLGAVEAATTHKELYEKLLAGLQQRYNR